MIGTYVFRSQGEIVAVSKNLLTTAGRREILRYLAGGRGSVGGSLGIGVGDTAPTLQDTDLMLEFSRLRVDVTSPDFLNGLVLFKGTIPQTVTGTIHEVGLWSSSLSILNIERLLSFNTDTEVWTGGTSTALNSRLGTQTLLVAAATGATTVATNSSFITDLSRIGNADSLVLSYFVSDANAATVRFRFRGEVPTNYFEYSGPTVPGYNVVKFNVGDLARVGTISLADIRSAEIQVTAKSVDVVGSAVGYTGTRVYFDGLSVKTARLDSTEDVLISRSIPVAPIVKTAVAPMDIEYYLEFNVS